jgi:hypothetical protein
MNQRDSYLANLGILTLITVIISLGYCLVQMVTNMAVFIKEQIKKEKQS